MSIEELLSSLKPSDLQRVALDLSERYRLGRKPFLLTKEHRLAYLVTRFPATFAAIQRVLHEINFLHVESLLDMGAGPGTGWLAAREVFPTLTKGTLVECDEPFITLGRKWVGEEAHFVRKEFQQLEKVEAHDVVLFSYSLGEISEKERERLVRLAWESARQAVVLIEPGTPEGFERIRFLRTKLLEWGAHLAAPCPHTEKCPMAGGDWCHFKVRLARTSLHRLAKQGERGFEDEKFSYLIAVKAPASPYEDRIIRHPLKGPGHISFTLCNAGKLKNKVVTKREGEFYKKAKKLEWGDVL